MKIRIPVAFLRQLLIRMDSDPSPTNSRFLFHTEGGNILEAVRIRGVQVEGLGQNLRGEDNPPRALDAIDFQYNTED